MSRSYRKTLCIKDSGNKGKFFANRRVRRTPNIPNGGAYKKVYDQYDICDHASEETFQEYLRGKQHWIFILYWHFGKIEELDEAQAWADWVKMYYWK